MIPDTVTGKDDTAFTAFDPIDICRAMGTMDQCWACTMTGRCGHAVPPSGGRTIASDSAGASIS